MPQQSKKNTKKSEAKTVEIDYDRLTVRDCLVWEHSKQGRQARGRSAQMNQEEHNTHFIPKKGNLGRPVDRGYELPDTSYNPHPDDSGTASEALRGWPGMRHQQEEMEDQHEKCQPSSASAKKNKKGKNKSKDTANEEVGDPYIADLIAHRYLSEFAKKRAIEMEKERRRKEAKENAAQIPAWKKKTDIKSNKTSQLRSIALAEKVDTDARDLWQMPKFKDKAQPQLSTFRNGPKATGSGYQKRGYVSNNGEVVPVCTCADNSKELEDHDGRAYCDGELEERYAQHPAMDDARDAQF